MNLYVAYKIKALLIYYKEIVKLISNVVLKKEKKLLQILKTINLFYLSQCYLTHNDTVLSFNNKMHLIEFLHGFS